MCRPPMWVTHLGQIRGEDMETAMRYSARLNQQLFSTADIAAAHALVESGFAGQSRN